MLYEKYNKCYILGFGKLGIKGSKKFQEEFNDKKILGGNNRFPEFNHLNPWNFFSDENSKKIIKFIENSESKTILIGQSLGGILALKVLLESSEEVRSKIESIVLLDIKYSIDWKNLFAFLSFPWACLYSLFFNKKVSQILERYKKFKEQDSNVPAIYNFIPEKKIWRLIPPLKSVTNKELFDELYTIKSKHSSIWKYIALVIECLYKK